MNTEWHFPVMIAASFVEFIGVLRLILGRATFRRRILAVIVLAVIVVIAGMLFGKYGANAGLPWWIYYPLPAVVTILLPPIVFRLRGRRVLAYLALAALSAPLIHVLFSLILGWGEYMPFWPVPTFTELISPGQ